MRTLFAVAVSLALLSLVAAQQCSCCDNDGTCDCNYYNSCPCCSGYTAPGWWATWWIWFVIVFVLMACCGGGYRYRRYYRRAVIVTVPTDYVPYTDGTTTYTYPLYAQPQYPQVVVQQAYPQSAVATGYPAYQPQR